MSGPALFSASLNSPKLVIPAFIAGTYCSETQKFKSNSPRNEFSKPLGICSGATMDHRNKCGDDKV
jgi:hypothetical protein